MSKARSRIFNSEKANKPLSQNKTNKLAPSCACADLIALSQVDILHHGWKKKKRKKKTADEPKSYKRSTHLEDKKLHESNGGSALMLAQAGIRATLVNRHAKNDKSSIHLLTGKGISTGCERDLFDTNKTGYYKRCAIANTCRFPPLLRRQHY